MSPKFFRLRIVILLATAISLLLPGCSALGRLLPWKKKPKPPRATAKVDQVVGTVTMVDEQASFVLIDNGTLPSPNAGTILKIRTTTAAAPVVLRVTQVRKPPYVVADIVKGTPKKGDEVYQ